MAKNTIKGLLTSKHWFTAGCLVAITLWFFVDIIFKGHLLWGSDFISTYLPYKQFLYEEIQHHGTIPMWNPYLFGGMPFWGFFESTIFYPLDLPFWFISPEKVYGYIMALHILMAGLFMYALCQSLHLSKWGSLFAAIIFSYNNFIIPVLSLGHMVHVQSYAWTPLVLSLFIRSLESKRPVYMAIWAGFCWGLQILAADPQTAFYTYLALVLFAMISYPALTSHAKCLHAIKILFMVFLIGFGLSAIQVIPALELVRLSTRGIMKTYELITLASFPPQGIITLLMPHFYGNLFESNFWVANMPWSIPEFNLYVGITPLLLIFFVKYRPISEEKVPLFFVILAILSFILALGKHTPIYHLFCHLPGFNSFRAPSKIIVLWMLSVSVLAGKGLDDLNSTGNKKPLWKWLFMGGVSLSFIVIGIWLYIHPWETTNLFSSFLLKPNSSESLAMVSQIIQSQFNRMIILTCLGLTVLYLGFKGTLRRNTWISLSLIILFVDLCGLNHQYVQQYDEDYAQMKRGKIQLSQIFASDKEIFRVGGLGSCFGPNAEMYYGLQSPAGAGPLLLFRYYLYCDQFYKKVYPKGWQVLWYGTQGSEKFMDMLNVKYEIDHEKKIVYTRKNYLPRALLIPGHRFLPSSEVLPHMASEDFNPKNTILLEKNSLSEITAPEAPEPNNGEIGSCKILHYRPDSIHLKVSANRSTFLVLNDIYYPGWKCYVDGVPQTILRCNYLFRAIKIQKGNHNVRFLFKPLFVKLGIIITLVTLFLSLIILRRKYSKKTS